MVPALEAVIKYGGQMGVERDRRRHGPPRPAQRPRQRHGQALSRDLPRIRRRRDQPGRCRRLGRRQISSRHLVRPRVRRHQGPSVAASPTPSHLEAVDPVVLGKVRARCRPRAATARATRCCRSCSTATRPSPGRASSPNASASPACPATAPAARIHFVINNQVGFTTSPQFARSSPYPSDVAKGVQAPILHVNGDDPEAVTFAASWRSSIRQEFNRDIVIDMWCYRRFGHNEGDEPSFTQPLMYAAIRKHPPISEIYGERLIAEGVSTRPGSTARPAEFTALLESEFEAAPVLSAQQGRLVRGPLGGPRPARRAGRPSAATSPPAIERGAGATSSAKLLTTVPDGPRRSTRRWRASSTPSARCSKAARASTGRPPRRSPSAACSRRAIRVRLSGQDSAAAAPSASATRSGSTRQTGANISR